MTDPDLELQGRGAWVHCGLFCAGSRVYNLLEGILTRRGRKKAMPFRKIVIAVTWVLVFSGMAAAQEPEFTQAESPFQDEFEYRVDTDLRPRVEVDGVRWVRFGVHAKEGQEIVADEEIPVTVEVDVVNQSPDTARVLVIVLFEDAEGAPLDRIECKQFKVSGERGKDSVQKFKLAGRVLLDTRKVYLYCEVER